MFVTSFCSSLTCLNDFSASNSAALLLLLQKERFTRGVIFTKDISEFISLMSWVSVIIHIFQFFIFLPWLFATKRPFDLTRVWRPFSVDRCITGRVYPVISTILVVLRSLLLFTLYAARDRKHSGRSWKRNNTKSICVVYFHINGRRGRNTNKRSAR